MRKFTPSAPLADNFIGETDWQKDDNIIVTHDDLYAHTWDTNFGTDPFDTELPDNEQDEIQEYVPINRPHSLEISKNSRGAPVEQTAVPNEETPTENAENEIDAIDNQQDLQPNPTIDAEKSSGNTDENQENDEVQKEKNPNNTRGEKYNLRPYPNPNISDSYRYYKQRLTNLKSSYFSSSSFLLKWNSKYKQKVYRYKSENHPLREQMMSVLEDTSTTLFLLF